MIDLWIDTDMGGDIDDAFTLAMALNSPQLHLRGISTVYIANQWRKDLVCSMVQAYGQSVPVYMGAERPICGSWGQEACDMQNEAVNAIVKEARACSMHLLAIGPLTNVALALLQAPDIAVNLNIYVMGGMVSCAEPEWNIKCDPEAAQIVLQSQAKITMVGLDVTEQCRLTNEQAIALVQGTQPSMTFLQGELKRFFELFTFSPVLHDPLTLLCILQPDVCRYRLMEIQVETGGTWTRGVTVNRRFSQEPRILVAVEVDAVKAVEEICQLIRGETTK